MGNTSVGGTLTIQSYTDVKGNTTLEGSLTQANSGATKFSVDTSGNQYTAGYWTCGTTTRFGASAQTIQASVINSPAISASNSIGQVLLVPYCGVTGYNLSTQLNDAGLFYNTNASQGFAIGPWTGTAYAIRIDSNGNTTITGSLTLSSAMTLPSSYSALPASTCLGYQNMAITTSGALSNGVWLNLNSTALNLTAGTWLVTASCVLKTGTSTTCTSVQGAIFTSNSAPDSYAARTNIYAMCGVCFRRY